MATKKTAKKATTKTAATKSTKKAPKKVVKKAPSKKVQQQALAKTEPVKQTKTTTDQQVTIRTPYVALIIAILILGALLYYFRGLFVAAVVNGQPISRIQVVQQAEKQSGKQTLDTLVRDALIEQEAKKENVTVSDQEVNAEIAKLEGNLKKQGQSLDQVLAAQGMSQNDLRRLIRLDKLVQKMVGKKMTVSDKEVSDYIDKNKDSLPNTDDATLRKQVKAQLTQQKTNEAVQTWLADIQQKANIVYFVQY